MSGHASPRLTKSCSVALALASANAHTTRCAVQVYPLVHAIIVTQAKISFSGLQNNATRLEAVRALVPDLFELCVRSPNRVLRRR